MDEKLRIALQNGKADPNMKTVWMIKWIFSFTFLFIFILAFVGIPLVPIWSNIGPFGIIFFYIIFPLILGIIFAYLWAHLYWSHYHFDVGIEKITITRGVIGKRIINIPYERVQNINIFRGVLDRIMGIYSIQIETAGGFSVGSTGGYGTRMSSEGSIQGLRNPQPIADYILAKAKGRDGLGDISSSGGELTQDDKLKMLEDRLLRGEISEKTYRELKEKYEQS